MKTAFIIEADPKVTSDIKLNLEALDPRLQIFDYSDVEKFLEWREGYFKSIAENKNIKLIDPALVVAGYDLLGPKNQSIAVDIISQFVEKGLRTQDNPTNIILSAFETPDFHPKKLDPKVYHNVVVQPFDKVILMQHLRVGLSGTASIKDTTVFKQKVTTKIEILKDAVLFRISEVGFSTKSSRAVEVGKVSKYYSNYFGGGVMGSVYGRCVSCTPEAGVENSFILDFEYLGLANDQFPLLRKMVIRDAPKSPIPKPQSAVKKVDLVGVNLAIIDSEKNEGANLKEVLEKRFSNCKGYIFSGANDFYSQIDSDLIEAKTDFKKSVFSKGNPLKIYLSLSNQLLGFGATPDPGMEVLGYPIATAMETGFFDKIVHPDDNMRLKKIFASDIPKTSSEATVVFKLPSAKWHGWEFQSKTISQHEKFGRCIEYVIRELTDVEARLFWQRKQAIKFPIHAICISASYLNSDFKKKLPDVLKKVQIHNEKLNEKSPPKVLLISSKQFQGEEKIELFNLFSDFIYEPFDRIYLIKRFYSWFPRLISKEDPVEITVRQTNEIISIANPTELLDISEAGLTVKYHRPISTGSLRRFSIGVKGGETIDLLANCHHSEPMGEIHVNQFVFYAVTDKSLKHIRKWIVENYVLTKQGE